MPEALTILHLTPRGVPGGAQLVATRLADQQQADGHRVHIASGPPPLMWEGPVISLPRLERNVTGLPAARRAVTAAIEQTRPDVIHCHGIGLGLAVALATRRGRSTPACTTVHGLQPPEYRWAAPVLRISGLPVVGVASVVEDRLRASGLRNVRTIPNGVPPSAPADRAAVQERWPQIPEGLPLIVSAGRLIPDKGHEALVEAVAQVPDVALLVLGEGPRARPLARRVEELGLGDRVVLGGWQPDAASLVGAADVAVQPSNVEPGLSLSALEALQAGVPLITGNSAIYQTYFGDGAAALVVDGSSATALADGIRRVLGEPGLADRLRAGAEAFVTRHSFEAMASSYEALYRELIHRRRPVRSRHVVEPRGRHT